MPSGSSHFGRELLSCGRALLSGLGSLGRCELGCKIGLGHGNRRDGAVQLPDHVIGNIAPWISREHRLTLEQDITFPALENAFRDGLKLRAEFRDRRCAGLLQLGLTKLFHLLMTLSASDERLVALAKRFLTEGGALLLETAAFDINGCLLRLKLRRHLFGERAELGINGLTGLAFTNDALLVEEQDLSVSAPLSECAVARKGQGERGEECRKRVRECHVVLPSIEVFGLPQPVGKIHPVGRKDEQAPLEPPARGEAEALRPVIIFNHQGLGEVDLDRTKG